MEMEIIIIKYPEIGQRFGQLTIICKSYRKDPRGLAYGDVSAITAMSASLVPMFYFEFVGRKYAFAIGTLYNK